MVGGHELKWALLSCTGEWVTIQPMSQREPVAPTPLGFGLNAHPLSTRLMRGMGSYALFMWYKCH
ncbi:hypothetical protein EBZ35_06510 [bacterium]|nr:hypothetical protein [bacterium]